MAITKKYALIIFDDEKIHDINQTVIQYSESSHKSASHFLFETEPINAEDTAQDLTYFRLSAEDDEGIKKKMDELIEELDKFDTFYSIRNLETGDVYTVIATVGALDIKFDNIKVIPKGTYKKIDAIKNIKVEYGYCKGYKPTFRPLEGNSIENLKINDETIYLFCKSSEDMKKLQDYLTEKIMEINPDFEIGTRIFI